MAKSLLPQDRPVREPAHLKNEMHAFRYGMAPLPEAYITYHRDLAIAELIRLEELFGFRVVEQCFENDGWMDSMKCMVVTVVTKNGNARRIKWNDGNRGFMRKCDGGGWAQLHEEDLH